MVEGGQNVIQNGPKYGPACLSHHHWKSFSIWCYSLNCKHLLIERLKQRRIHRFWKGVELYVGHHGWLTKEILVSRESKKAKATLETISFWQNISISIFKFSPFLYTMKAWEWNLRNFSKFANALIKKDKKTYAVVNEKRKIEKSWTLFYNRSFF